MPRLMGTRWGTKVSETGSPACASRMASISGLCRWAATLYGLNDSATSQMWVVSEAPRPAPLTPLLASATSPSVATSFWRSNGINGSRTLVG